jgi:phenylpyruvate tautomerase PptA (4-oxalocrotonate tautomerase family)
MPRIRVEWLVGRTEAQRRELASRITTAMCDVARVGPDEVTVVYEEVDRNKMFKGAIPWSERETKPMVGTGKD